MPNPIPEQTQIIDETDSCVVIAKPGSGKTFTIAIKIANVLEFLPSHKGVVAISYTNKASNELKQRVLKLIADRKSSFFGTLDKFFISEIVLPFLPHVFGSPIADVEVVHSNSLIRDEQNLLHEANSLGVNKLERKHWEVLRDVFLSGRLVLECVGLYANLVFDRSSAARRYLKARYSHIFIDEYQDSGFYQHVLLLRLHKLGLKAVAVGDMDQSIYGFSNRSSKYLSDLASNEEFATYSLSINHRCHPSIANYSLSLISTNPALVSTVDKRVFLISIEGDETDIALWIDNNLDRLTARFGINHHNEVGILVRSNRTAELISKNINRPHKLFGETPLDNNSSIWGTLFRKILVQSYSKDGTRREILDEIFDSEFEYEKTLKAARILKTINESLSSLTFDAVELLSKFERLATLAYPKAKNKEALVILAKILKDSTLMDSFIPAGPDELQIMTLHKAKGLEFKLVFHLDLYNYIIPSYDALVKGDRAIELQDLNLHYVGVTRAIEACILCTSKYRTNSNGERKQGVSSDFIFRNNVESLRDEL